MSIRAADQEGASIKDQLGPGKRERRGSRARIRGGLAEHHWSRRSANGAEAWLEVDEGMRLPRREDRPDRRYVGV